MEVTELRIRKVTAEGKLKAYVTVTFDNCFVVHNVKIIEGKDGLFIASAVPLCVVVFSPEIHTSFVGVVVIITPECHSFIPN